MGFGCVGITYPSEKESLYEIALAARSSSLHTVIVDTEDQYAVLLP